MKKATWNEVSNLQNRSGVWASKAMLADSKGDFDRAGRLRTKSLQLSYQAEKMRKELKELGQ